MGVISMYMVRAVEKEASTDFSLTHLRSFETLCCYVARVTMRQHQGVPGNLGRD